MCVLSPHDLLDSVCIHTNFAGCLRREKEICKAGKTFSFPASCRLSDSLKLTDMIHYLSHLSLIFISEGTVGGMQEISTIYVWTGVNVRFSHLKFLVEKISHLETFQHTQLTLPFLQNNEKCLANTKSLNRRRRGGKSINYNIARKRTEEKREKLHMKREKLYQSL